MLSFHGRWRITVVSKDADFDQRVVVRTDFGDRVLPGRAGAVLEADGENWRLSLEHLLWGRSWQPNVRTVPGPVTERDGVRSQLLTSSDCQWPGKPMDYPNLVVRLDQSLGARPAPTRTSAEAPLSSASQGIRTSSDAGFGVPGRLASTPGQRSASAQW